MTPEIAIKHNQRLTLVHAVCTAFDTYLQTGAARHSAAV